MFSVPEIEKGLRVYPNPTSGEVRFTGCSETQSYRYKIYTLVGREVLLGRLHSDGLLDLSVLSSAQYILVLEDERGSEVLRTRLLLLR